MKEIIVDMEQKIQYLLDKLQEIRGYL